MCPPLLSLPLVGASIRDVCMYIGWVRCISVPASVHVSTSVRSLGPPARAGAPSPLGSVFALKWRLPPLPAECVGRSETFPILPVIHENKHPSANPLHYCLPARVLLCPTCLVNLSLALPSCLPSDTSKVGQPGPTFGSLARRWPPRSHR